MRFPVVFQIGSLQISAHFLFESLAYLIAFQVFLYQKRKQADPLETEQRYAVIAAAIVGAVLGSKFLYWLIDPIQSLQKWNDLKYLMSGKTIVGALAGGLLSVELAKKMLHIKKRSGDLFAIPLAIGIALGRVGCFFSGLSDNTHGVASGLAWAFDFGDGVPRHPVQLYEIFYLGVLIVFLRQVQKKKLPLGDLFKIFMISYFSFRLMIDFIKPGIFFWGLNAIQWTCVAMLLYYGQDIVRFIFMKKIQKRELA